MIVTPKNNTVNVTQSLIRNFIPIPNYDAAFGIVGMYSFMDFIIENPEDSIPNKIAIYVVIDPMEISIEAETLHKYIINKSSRIILAGNEIVVEINIDEWVADVYKMLKGEYSKVSEEGKRKLLEGIPESKESGDGRIRDNRWSIFHPTADELKRLARRLGVNGGLKEIMSAPDVSSESFWIIIDKHIYDFLYAN